jgi:hypothetical protein
MRVAALTRLQAPTHGMLRIVSRVIDIGLSPLVFAKLLADRVANVPELRQHRPTRSSSAFLCLLSSLASDSDSDADPDPNFAPPTTG